MASSAGRAAIKSSSADRLVYMLFIATLAHGLVILGVSFDYEPPAGSDAQPLEVALISEDTQVDAPQDARYIAQANQRGAGEPVQDRAGAEVSQASPFMNEGEATAHAPLLSDPGELAPPEDVIVSPSANDAQHALPKQVSERPDTVAMQARLWQPTPDSAVQLDGDMLVVPSGNYPDELLVSVDTRRADVALYLQTWKAKIEQVGTLHFPDAARQQGLSGSPVLEVAVAADGRLRQILVVRPSAHKLLDQAALRILRLAAPFDPFPQALAGEHQTLRFIYEWQFIGGAPVGGRMSSAVPETP